VSGRDGGRADPRATVPAASATWCRLLLDVGGSPAIIIATSENQMSVIQSAWTAANARAASAPAAAPGATSLARLGPAEAGIPT
jgi:hypothetical protein